MKGTLVKILILAAILVVAGCRIGAAVFQGGDVISASGERNCLQGRTCEFQVTDTNFTETFTAQPKVGYEFVKWRAGDGYLCGNSTDPVCTVSNVGSAGNAAIEAVVASDTMLYVAPEFTCILESCPEILLDTVLLELEDHGKVVEAYVASVGNYPIVPSVFGINTAPRPAGSLISMLYVGPPALYPGGPVYITAEVYNSLWDGSGTPNYEAVSYFSLSGYTNADNTMTWHCIPGDGNGGVAVPYHYLPLQCRG